MRTLFASRWSRPGFLLLVTAVMSAALADNRHPLQVHMDPWLQGSGDWRTPNPDYQPPAGPGDPDNGIREFAVRWAWDDADKSAKGELLGLRTDGSSQKFWSLFAFYNPVTKEVTYIQTGAGGAFITGKVAAREQPLSAGEKDVLDTTDYWPNGTVRESRHENTFDGGTHTSIVFERSEAGGWQQKAVWEWTLRESDEKF